MRSSEVRRILAEVGVKPDRKLGQNFLLNDTIAARIAVEASTEGSVMEIGPGLGALTGRLLARCGSVTAVEISGRMAERLRTVYAGHGLEVVHGDALRVSPDELAGYPFETLAGNLPYSISSPVLFRLLEDGFRHVEKAVLMLQREVAVRLSTLQGGKDTGRLSLLFWPYFAVRDLLDAEPEDFFPEPVIRSRVVVLQRRREQLVPEELAEIYARLVRTGFASRRKTILNNLSTLFGRDRSAEALASAGIDPGLRAEEMGPERFVTLAGEFR